VQATRGMMVRSSVTGSTGRPAISPCWPADIRHRDRTGALLAPGGPCFRRAGARRRGHSRRRLRGRHRDTAEIITAMAARHRSSQRWSISRISSIADEAAPSATRRHPRFTPSSGGGRSLAESRLRRRCRRDRAWPDRRRGDRLREAGLPAEVRWRRILASSALGERTRGSADDRGVRRGPRPQGPYDLSASSLAARSSAPSAASAAVEPQAGRSLAQWATAKHWPARSSPRRPRTQARSAFPRDTGNLTTTVRVRRGIRRPPSCPEDAPGYLSD
jgi:hypothetical protein